MGGDESDEQYSAQLFIYSPDVILSQIFFLHAFVIESVGDQLKSYLGEIDDNDDDWKQKIDVGCQQFKSKLLMVFQNKFLGIKEKLRSLLCIPRCSLLPEDQVHSNTDKSEVDLKLGTEVFDLIRTFEEAKQKLNKRKDESRLLKTQLMRYRHFYSLCEKLVASLNESLDVERFINHQAKVTNFPQQAFFQEQLDCILLNDVVETYTTFAQVNY